MGMIEEVALHLSETSTRFVAGVSMFANAHPPVDVASFSMWETGGGPPVQAYGSTLPTWEEPTLQLLAKTTRPSSGSLVPYSSNARSLIHDALVILNRVVNQSLTGSTAYYLRIEPRQAVAVLPGQEEDGRIMFSVNLDVLRRPSVTY
ncbi:MAG: hypothetical protein ACEQSX_08195 [Baekduiaceae bacterium]